MYKAESHQSLCANQSTHAIHPTNDQTDDQNSIDAAKNRSDQTQWIPVKIKVSVIKSSCKEHFRVTVEKRCKKLNLSYVCRYVWVLWMNTRRIRGFEFGDGPTKCLQ